MTTARLALHTVCDSRGRTRICLLDQQFPLRTTGLMYLEAADPGMAHAYLQNPSGALFDGDHHEMAIRLGAQSRLHLTTQSATRIARSAGSGTSQRASLTLAEGSYLEYVPDALVPMAGAVLRQETTVRLDTAARYLGVEMLTPGRIAHGERFEYERARLHTQVERADGACCRDTVQLSPGQEAPGRAGVMGAHLQCATVLAVGPAAFSPTLLSALSPMAVGLPAVFGAATALPDDLGVLVRLLSEKVTALRRGVQQLVDAARFVLAGLPASLVRK